MKLEERTVTAGSCASFGLLAPLLGGMNPSFSSKDDILWHTSSRLYLQTPRTREWYLSTANIKLAALTKLEGMVIKKPKRLKAAQSRYFCSLKQQAMPPARGSPGTARGKAGGRSAHAEHCRGMICSPGRWRKEEAVHGRDQWAVLKCQLAFDISLSFVAF